MSPPACSGRNGARLCETHQPQHAARRRRTELSSRSYFIHPLRLVVQTQSRSESAAARGAGRRSAPSLPVRSRLVINRNVLHQERVSGGVSCEGCAVPKDEIQVSFAATVQEVEKCRSVRAGGKQSVELLPLAIADDVAEVAAFIVAAGCRFEADVDVSARGQLVAETEARLPEMRRAQSVVRPFRDTARAQNKAPIILSDGRRLGVHAKTEHAGRPAVWGRLGCIFGEGENAIAQVGSAEDVEVAMNQTGVRRREHAAAINRGGSFCAGGFV